jgi:hypothetical protein
VWASADVNIAAVATSFLLLPQFILKVVALAGVLKNQSIIKYYGTIGLSIIGPLTWENYRNKESNYRTTDYRNKEKNRCPALPFTLNLSLGFLKPTVVSKTQVQYITYRIM